jgi:hypothetical protein
VVVFAQYTLIAVRPIARQLVSATKLYVEQPPMSRQAESAISRNIAATVSELSPKCRPYQTSHDAKMPGVADRRLRRSVTPITALSS